MGHARKLSGLVAGGIIAASLVIFSTSAALATEIPDDVADLFGCADESSRSGLGEEVCATGTVLAPHAVYHWTDAFRLGEDTNDVLTEPTDWIAAKATTAGDPLGTVLVSTWDGPAAIVGTSDDATLATTLATLGAGQLVEDAPAGAWYLIEAGTITPLNDWAAGIVPATMPLSDAQPLIVANEEARLQAWNEAQPFGLDQNVGTGLVVFGVLAALAVLAAVVLTRRRRLT